MLQSRIQHHRPTRHGGRARISFKMQVGRKVLHQPFGRQRQRDPTAQRRESLGQIRQRQCGLPIHRQGRQINLLPRGLCRRLSSLGFLLTLNRRTGRIGCRSRRVWCRGARLFGRDRRRVR